MFRSVVIVISGITLLSLIVIVSGAIARVAAESRDKSISHTVQHEFVKLKKMHGDSYRSNDDGSTPVPATIRLGAELTQTLQQLTEEPIEYAGALYTDTHARSGDVVLTGLSINPGQHLTSMMPDSPFNYHTHSSAAYANGNTYNYPSSDDLMTMLLLNMPGHANVVSFVVTREGVYSVQILPALRQHVLTQWVPMNMADIVQAYRQKQNDVQNIIDNTLYENNIDAYLTALRAQGWLVALHPWNMSDSLVIYLAV